MLKKSTFLLTLIISFRALAIVDYTESSYDKKESSDGPVNKSRASLSSPASKPLVWHSDFSFLANFESLKIEQEKMGVLNLNTHWQTPFNVFFDFSYWSANSKSGNQNGNPKAILGFNWLRLGAPSEEARVDLYGGARIAGNSELASSRTDKIFGAETTKRFGTFGLGLGYELTATGLPKKSQDMGLGNIQRLSFSGGWMVSNDIQFEILAESFKIGESKDTSRSQYLKKAVSFSTLSPKLNLNLAPAVGLELGARFRTNKIKSDQDLRSAKLFDLAGAYSNSLMAGLNLSI